MTVSPQIYKIPLMAAILRSVIGIFWAASAGFIGFLAYIVIETEHNPQLRWAWLTMCGLTLLSATWLAYNMIFVRRSKPEPKRHDLHLR